jgi:tRNA(fMet)-specific endonuclease VapC
VIILDTDHIAYVQKPKGREGTYLRERLLLSTDQDIRLTSISLEEQMRGWLAAIRRTQDVERPVKYYDRLVETNEFFTKWELQRFDERAADIFGDLRQQRVRIGTQDLKIASICLANDALLLSRNLVDFQQVPGLRVENWIPD